MKIQFKIFQFIHLTITIKIEKQHFKKILRNHRKIKKKFTIRMIMKRII